MFRNRNHRRYGSGIIETAAFAHDSKIDGVESTDSPSFELLEPGALAIGDRLSTLPGATPGPVEELQSSNNQA